jgi:hypothetical protein
MPYAPTTTQLLNFDGVYQRADSFRFDLLDATEEVIGTLNPQAEPTPVVSVNTSSQVHRTLTNFNLPPDELADINVLSDRVQAWMVLENGEEFSLGVFLWGNDDRPYESWGTRSTSTLVDKMLILNQGIEHTIGFNRGADIGIAVLGVALEVLELEDIIIDTISADLGASRADSPGTARSQVLDDFMGVIGFLPSHFNRDGKLRLVDTPDLSVSSPTIPAYTDGPDSRVVAGSVTLSDDSLDAPNVYIVYETSGQSTVIGRYDIPDAEAHSEINRGFAAPLVEARTGLKSTASANKAAKAMATTNAKTFKWANWTSTADPRHDIWDPVTLLGVNYIETAWSLPCRSGGLMSHTARAVF